MSTRNLTKVSYKQNSSGSLFWDDGGRSKISKIYISCGRNGVDGLQFVYVENGYPLSGEIHGNFGHSSNLTVIDFDHHHNEVVTGLRGHHDHLDKLCSFSIVTNKGTYGPYGRGHTDGNLDNFIPFNFQLGDGSSFGGFHGLFVRDGPVLESIGVYVKAMKTYKDIDELLNDLKDDLNDAVLF